MADMTTLVGYLGGLSGNQVTQLIGWLAPLTVNNMLTLVAPLSADGVSGAQIYDLVQVFKGAGQDGVQIRWHIENMRGNLDPAAVDITTPGGNKILIGPQIHVHATAILASGLGGLANLNRYPTGQDPIGIDENTLWEHCRLETTLTNAAGVVETVVQKQIRQRMALNTLINQAGVVPKIVQQLFLYYEGAAQRPIFTVAEEDALAPSAHTSARHVFGTGNPINNMADLAMRVLRHKANGINMPCPSKVGAFSNPADAQAAIQAAMNAHFGVPPPLGAAPSANWQAARQQIIRGGTINLDVHVGGVVGHILIINPGPTPYHLVGGGKMNNRGLPKYLGGTRCGGRPLYDTDGGFAAAMAPYVYTHPPGSANQWIGHYLSVGYIRYEPAIGLSIDNAAPVSVHLRIIGHDVLGGWSIHSAWPI